MKSVQKGNAINSIKRIYTQNKSLILVILAYAIIERFSMVHPLFKQAFRDNPDVSHFWVWFALQFGFHVILFVLIWKAPFRKENIKSYCIGIGILLSLILRICLIAGILWPALVESGFHVDKNYFHFFFNMGKYYVPFFGNFGIPVFMAYSEIFVLFFHLVDRSRIMVHSHNRKLYSLQTLFDFLLIREARKKAE